MKKAAAASLAMLLATSTLPQPILAAGPHGQETTATPIKHLVVIFQENVSFDHYFGTYPYALNPRGEPKFIAKPGTPSVNGLTETPPDQQSERQQHRKRKRRHEPFPA